MAGSPRSRSACRPGFGSSSHTELFVTLITVAGGLTPSWLPWVPGTRVVYILTSRHITYNITNLKDNNENKQPKFLETQRPVVDCVEDRRCHCLCAGVSPEHLPGEERVKCTLVTVVSHIKTPVVLSKFALKYFPLLVILHSSFLSFPASLLLQSLESNPGPCGC